MPRGTPVNWTRELLERAQIAVGTDDITALAEELGVSPATIYSAKGRIASEGVDEILKKQSQRNQSYERGGARRPETLEEQLTRIYLISVSAGGRGGIQPQYGVTLPSHVGRTWVERWGRQVRFVPTQEGLLIQPVEPQPAPEIPTWLTYEDHDE